MTPERWERLKQVFQDALEQPEERRPAFLDEACAGDAGLRAEAEALLSSHVAAGSFIEHAPAPELAAALDEARSGAPHPRAELERVAIGGFRLLRRIAAGGMGVVYEAEQERPHRLVALKVIRGGSLAGDTRIRLFEREVEALARLKHPGIAAIYQAGQTDDGEPFFAMELAHGTTLGEALRGEGPAAPAVRELRPRLRLFVKLCEAVNYAHQRGVVHRDLKPANILVGPAPDSAGASALPEIKILDFGLARVTDPDGASPHVTQAGTIQGTFAYMSPEQARGRPDDIDLRTDVYSLGVILYELVAGRPPYELGDCPPPEALRIVCEQPPRSLRGLARAGGAAPRVARDLETIVMKALEKEPARRYQSALALAEELERYLADEPILARAPSATYQLGRLVRRNRAAFGAAAAVFLLVLAAAVFMTIERNRARTAEAQARREAARATAIKDFLKGILASGDPRRSGRDARMLDVLQTTARDMQAGLPGEPEVEAALRDTLSEAFYFLGEYEAARQQAQQAAAIHERVFSREHLATQKSLDNLVAALIGQGRFPEAEQLAREVLERKQRLPGGAQRETLGSKSNLSAVLLAQGRFPEAETVSREIAEAGERVLPPGDDVTMTALNNLGLALRRQEKLEEAEAVLRKLVAASILAHGESHPETLAYSTNLVSALGGRGKLAEAEPLARRVFEQKTRLLGASHAETVISQSSLGLLLCRQKREEGVQVLRELLKVVEAPGFQGRYPPALYQGRLGDCLRELGRYPEAERAMLASYAGLDAKLGAQDARTRDRAVELAELYEDWKKPAQATPWRVRGEAQAPRR